MYGEIQGSKARSRLKNLGFGLVRLQEFETPPLI